MNKKKAITSLVLLFLGLLSVISFTGCAKDYKRNDIKNYVEETLGFHNYTVSSEGVHFEGENERNTAWTVTNLDNHILFHVKTVYSSGLFGMESNLYNDYETCLLQSHRNEFPSLTHWEYRFNDDSGLNYFNIHATYRNRNELAECREELDEFRRYVKDLNLNLDSLHFNLNYNHPYRNQTNHELTDGDIHGNLLDWTEYTETYCLCAYLRTALDYYYEDALAEFEEDEIRTLIQENPKAFYNVGIIRSEATITTDEDGISHQTEEVVEWYDDLVASYFGYGISFSTLYFILEREGFAPVGDPTHFSFTGIDGCTYEMSYSFDDATYTTNDGSEMVGYYYLKDGETVFMDYYFYNHFRSQPIQQMTGILLKIGRQD